MEQIMNYVKPELIVVAVVLYFIGIGLKQSQTIKDKYIPLILGLIGIILCAIWVIATSPLSTMQEIAMAIFTAVVQGILVAGLSIYVNQIIKQANKEEWTVTILHISSAMHRYLKAECASLFVADWFRIFVQGVLP